MALLTWDQEVPDPKGPPSWILLSGIRGSCRQLGDSSIDRISGFVSFSLGQFG